MRAERYWRAQQAIAELRLFQLLAAYRPLLAGTIPLGIDLPESDLDIICQVTDQGAFRRDLAPLASQADFRVRTKPGVIICNFTYSGFAFELYGQPGPPERSQAYLHMVAEARLLALAGPGAVQAIRALKAKGLKTEPAFAAYFGLAGDPYQVLLELAEAPLAELVELVRWKLQ